MFIHFTDHGKNRWVNILHIIYFNGDFIYTSNGEILSVDKDCQERIANKLLGIEKI